MNQSLEETVSPTLKARLQALGFEQVQFEPKVSNRFIVQIDGFPSYVIKGIQPPTFTKKGWLGHLELQCYNPLETNLEEAAIALVSKEEVKITVKILSATAQVDTTWEFIGVDGEVQFGDYNWSDEGKPNMLIISFFVKEAKVIY